MNPIIILRLFIMKLKALCRVINYTFSPEYSKKDASDRLDEKEIAASKHTLGRMTMPRQRAYIEQNYLLGKRRRMYLITAAGLLALLLQIIQTVALIF